MRLCQRALVGSKAKTQALSSADMRGFEMASLMGFEPVLSA